MKAYGTTFVKDGGEKSFHAHVRFTHGDKTPVFF